MNVNNQIKQTISSLAKHKLRSCLSILGIVFGVMAVISMLSIGEGAKKEILDQIEQLGKSSLIVRYSDPGASKRNEYPLGLTFHDVLLLEKNFPEIHIASSHHIEATVQERNADLQAEILAVNSAYKGIRNLELAEGRFLCHLDEREQKRVCVIGHDVAKNLGLVGHVGQRININGTPFHIVGILPARDSNQKKAKSAALTMRDDNKMILIPQGVENGIIAQTSQSRDLDELIMKLPKEAELSSYAKVIDHILKKSHRGVQDYQIVIPQELLRQEQQAQNTFNLVLGAIAGISLIVGGIGIMNIMLAIVSERTKEIGIRRALGASKKHILIQFMMETLTLTTCGSLVGLALGIVTAFVISAFAEWSVIISFWSLFLAVGMSSCVGAVSGFYPAYKAAEMDPISALRHD